MNRFRLCSSGYGHRHDMYHQHFHELELQDTGVYHMCCGIRAFDAALARALAYVCLLQRNM